MMKMNASKAEVVLYVSAVVGALQGVWSAVDNRAAVSAGWNVLAVACFVVLAWKQRRRDAAASSHRQRAAAAAAVSTHAGGGGGIALPPRATPFEPVIEARRAERLVGRTPSPPIRMLPMLEKIRLPPRARPFREPSASVSPTDYPRPPRAAAAAPTHVAAPVAQRPAPVVAWNWRRYYATELPSTRKRLRAPEPGAPPAAKRPKLAQNLPPPQGGGGGQPPAGAPTPQPVLVVSPQQGVVEAFDCDAVSSAGGSAAGEDDDGGSDVVVISEDSSVGAVVDAYGPAPSGSESGDDDLFDDFPVLDDDDDEIELNE